MNRKTLTIIALVIVLILVGVGVYFLYFKKAPTTIIPTGTFPGEGLPVTGTPTTGLEGGEGEGFVPGGAAPLPRLYELHKLPVAGAGFSETKDKKGSVLSTSIRYIERGLGHIYETQLATYVESRIVNETRSRLSEALWGNNGKSVTTRYLDEEEGAIKTQILNMGAPITSSAQGTSTESLSEFLSVEEVFLPDYIPFVAVAEDGADKIFYLETGNSSSAGSLATLKNTGVTEVFSSTFTEWLPQFPNQKLVTLTTKPSAKVLGHLFFLDTKTKSLTKVLSGINGLTTLTSHDGNSVLYAEIRDNVPELAIYDVLKKETRHLSLQTLPEKCAWGTKNLVIYCAVPQTLPNATYPDQWYQGLLSFSDNIWKIDAKTGAIEKILTVSDLSTQSLDIVNPILSSNDTYLLFMNKVTGTPWVFRTAPDAPIQESTPVTTTSPTEPSVSVIEGMQKVR